MSGTDGPYGPTRWTDLTALSPVPAPLSAYALPTRRPVLTSCMMLGVAAGSTELPCYCTYSARPAPLCACARAMQSPVPRWRMRLGVRYTVSVAQLA
eukprot:700195-Rhodomonas_salina.2